MEDKAMKRRLLRCTWAALAGSLLAVLLLWLGASAPARAEPAIRYVRSTGGLDAGNDCKTPANPCATLQHAIAVANPGDEIHMARGIYTSTAGTVGVITKALHITGSFDPAFNGDPNPELYDTVLDAGGGGSVISITNAGEVALMHLTLTHGDGTGNCNPFGCGGGIYATGTNLQVGGCAITDNVGSSAGDTMGMGGGVYAFASGRHVHIWNSQILSNTANANPSSIYVSYGGGILVRYGTTSLEENQILDNVASIAGSGGWGGGIFLYAVEQGDVMSNTIHGNKGATNNYGGSGGGLALFASTVYMAGNHVENNWTNPNWAGYGGGVYLYGDTTAHLERNTIIGNATLPPNTGWSAPGGGVCIVSTEPVTLTNNLIAGNTASTDAGGGVYIGEASSPGSVLLAHNTLADNGSSGVVLDGEVVLTATNNLIARHETGLKRSWPLSGTILAQTNLFWNTSDPITGTNAVMADPLLRPDFRLNGGSPARDAGTSLPWVALDLAGVPRPQGAGYDIGAFEYAGDRMHLPLLLRP
jgi:hypothetical protein